MKRRRSRRTRFGNTVLRRGTPVRLTSTRRALLWLREGPDFVATTLDGRRYVIYREGRMQVLAVKAPGRVTRDIGMFNDMHEARRRAEEHAAGPALANRKKSRPSSRSNVARGMIAAGTGRAQKFRHKTARRAKEREESWRRDDWSDRRRRRRRRS